MELVKEEVIFMAKVKIQGLSPLIIHKCSIEAMQPKLSSNKDPDEWKKEIYLNQEGYLVMPALNIQASLVSGIGADKKGKVYLKRIFASDVLIDVENFHSLITINKSPINIDDIVKNRWLFTCLVVINRSRVPKTRVCIPEGWEIEFPVTVTNDLITPELLEAYINKAGKKSGLGVWRPNSPKPGRFGQYAVSKFDVV